jgi:hypothetical protein
MADFYGMQAFRFLSRVAFICNGCFVLSVLLQLLRHPPEGELVSTVIVLGRVLALALNVLVNGWFALLWLSRRSPNHFVPAWLLILNLLLLVPELMLLGR